MNEQLKIQQKIAKELNVCPYFNNQKDLEKEIKKRVEFLKNTLLDTKLKAFILGISGGIDSLCAGLLAKQAITELKQECKSNDYKLISINLPYKIQTDKDDVDTSFKYIKPDIKEIINIQDCVDSTCNLVKSLVNISEEKRDFIVGNIKARQRMVIQYAFANMHDALVLGTDHASEAVMGFFTKFGDGGFDLSPLSGLTKTQVKQIASFFGVEDRLVHKTPTANLEDLKPNYPDEFVLGVTYEEIDDFLHVKEVSKHVFKIITNAYYKTMHKRNLPLIPQS